jgi:hypothetical protein
MIDYGFVPHQQCQLVYFHTLIFQYQKTLPLDGEFNYSPAVLFFMYDLFVMIQKAEWCRLWFYDMGLLYVITVCVIFSKIYFFLFYILHSKECR